MRSFGKRVHGVLAASLSAALIVSGAVLTAPAAYAEEAPPVETVQPAETPTVETPETPEAPAAPAPEVPEEETPAEVETPADPEQEGSAMQGKGAPQSAARSGMSVLSEAPAAPAVVVSKTSGVDPEGEMITVTGTGFFPDAPATNGTRQPLNGKFGGAYVQFGYYDGTTWKGGSTQNPELTKWAVSPEDVAALGAAAVPVVDGGFVAELKPVPVAGAPEGAVYGIRTYGASGSTYAPFNTFTEITFATVNTGGGNTGGGTGGTSNNATAAGGMSWGIRGSFMNYVNGLSDGRIDTANVGGSIGNWFFPQTSSSGWNAATQTGTVSYSGSISVYGHGMHMLSFSNPVIHVSSPTNATLSSKGVHIANLNLGAASRSTGAGGAVTWSGVPTVLTAAGAAYFDNRYAAGTVMDPITFTVGASSRVSFGSTSTISAAAAALNRTAADTPPSTEGIEVVTPEEELVPGGEIEIEASGFEPNERNILVVLYSDPIVLDRNAGADATGKVRWIGTLPKDIKPGEHTITLQGSINVGKIITVIAADDVDKLNAKKLRIAAEAEGDLTEAAAGPASGEGSNAWVLWAGAIALLIVAGGMTALVVAQRRRNSVE